MSARNVVASRAARITIAMATALGFTFTAGTLSASAVPNDPGFCGVRSSGPTYAGGTVYTYGVRNKCGVAYTWKVYLPYPQRYAQGSVSYTTCQTVPAYSTSFWWAPVPDPNWSVQNC